MKNLKIYLIDDDEAVREALSLLLQTYGMYVETFRDPATFLAHVDPQKPGCLILDLRMPMISGLQLQQKLLERGIDWPAIMITGHGDINACRRAFKAGILDFLSKPVDEQVLLEALETASQELDKILERAEAQKLIARLTDREHEIFDLICKGFGSKEIAAALNISVRTIDAHRANIAEKLETSSVVDFVRLQLSGSSAGHP